MRFAWDVPFAIHFHVAADGEARIGASPETAELLLGSGEHWRLTAAGAAASIEESRHFADAAGAEPRQVVLRAQCHGETEVAWTLERIRPGRPRRAQPRGQRRGRPRRAARRPTTPASRAAGAEARLPRSCDPRLSLGRGPVSRPSIRANAGSRVANAHAKALPMTDQAIRRAP